jgi:hypothetical protein
MKVELRFGILELRFLALLNVFLYFLLCGILNDALSITDYTVLNEKMVRE